MAPTPVYRDSDDEHVGWLREDADGFSALTRLGHTLGTGLSEDAARELLTWSGLAAIAEPWWALAPTPLVAGTDLRSPAPDWTWRRVRAVEANAEQAWIGIDWAGPEERDVRVIVALPATDVLRARPEN